MKQISNAQFGKVEKNLHVIGVIDHVKSGNLFRLLTNKQEKTLYLVHFQPYPQQTLFFKFSDNAYSAYYSKNADTLAEYVYSIIAPSNPQEHNYDGLTTFLYNLNARLDHLIVFTGTNVYHSLMKGDV